MRRLMCVWMAAAWLATLLIGCGAEEQVDPTALEEVEAQRALKASPLPEPELDPTNAWEGDDRAARLGQFLFFDTRMSPSGDIACATCHAPDKGFSDGLATSVGVERVTRNSPTLWNITFNRWYFWDGRSDSLWGQALKPLEAPPEMGSDRMHMIHLVAEDADLRAAYEAIFGALPAALADVARFPRNARPVADDPEHPHQVAWAAMTPEDQETANQIAVNLAKSIAAYEHRLVTGHTPYDTYIEGLREGDETKQAALSESAQRGLKLFVGEALCWNCHNGPTLSDGVFHNIGLGAHPEFPVDFGRGKGIFQILGDPFNAMGAYSDAPDSPENDKLRFMRIDTRVQDGAFKTPPLRNVALTGPYMRDGRFTTLEEVVRFYSELDEQPPAGHREETLVPLDLSEQQIADVVAFLESLTSEPPDPSLLTQPPTPAP